MSDRTKIEWTDATWNPITGCSVVSPGCTNCYAMKLAGTRLQHHPSRAGLTTMTKAGPVWIGDVRFNEQWLDQPLRWRRPRRIFVCAHADLFHENVPDEWLDKVFAVMALAPQHVFQVLTKRPVRAREYIKAAAYRAPWMCDLICEQMGKIGGHDPRMTKTSDNPGWPLPNVWLGVSVEDQARADERIPILLDTPAAVRWISAEPLLGPVNIHEWTLGFSAGKGNEPARCAACGHGHGFSRCRNYGGVSPTCHKNGCACPRFRHTIGTGIDWVVAGGESGTGARPIHPDWARSLRDQCQAAGVAFHFKQHGNWLHNSQLDAEGRPGGELFELMVAEGRLHRWPDGSASIGGGKRAAGRLLDGRTWDEWPTAQASASGDPQ